MTNTESNDVGVLKDDIGKLESGLRTWRLGERYEHISGIVAHARALDRGAEAIRFERLMGAVPQGMLLYFVNGQEPIELYRLTTNPYDITTLDVYDDLQPQHVLALETGFRTREPEYFAGNYASYVAMTAIATALVAGGRLGIAADSTVAQALDAQASAYLRP